MFVSRSPWGQKTGRRQPSSCGSVGPSPLMCRLLPLLQARQSPFQTTQVTRYAAVCRIETKRLICIGAARLVGDVCRDKKHEARFLVAVSHTWPGGDHLPLNVLLFLILPPHASVDPSARPRRRSLGCNWYSLGSPLSTSQAAPPQCEAV